MSELVCPWCGRVSPGGSTACGACGASLQQDSPPHSEQAAPETPPEPEPLVEAAVEPPPPESPVEPVKPAQVAPAAPAPAAPAASGGTPSIASLMPCPNPGCFGVVAPGDAFCTFCGGRLPAAPAVVVPPPPPPPPPPSGPKPAGGGFHIPRGVWVVLSIIPLALCAVIAALVFVAIAAPPGMFDRQALPDVQKEAERVAWPSGTPTAAPTATRTATPSATPTATAAPAVGAKSPVPTTSSHATYTPVVPNLPAGTATLPLQGNLYTGVKVYALNTREYMFQIVGRATDCAVDPGYFTTNIAYQTRRATGKLEWWPEKYFDASNSNWVAPADDPALKTKQLTALTGCGK